jgi:hypothetical protein
VHRFPRRDSDDVTPPAARSPKGGLAPQARNAFGGSPARDLSSLANIYLKLCLICAQRYIVLLSEIAPERTGHGLPLSKCEAYNRVYDQPYESR